MDNLLLFLDSFLEYLILFVIIVVLVIIACVIGVKWRKIKYDKAEKLANADGGAVDSDK